MHVRKTRTAAGVSLACVVLTGCGSLYKLDVIAYNNPAVTTDKDYVFLSGSPRLPLGSPEFEDYARKVEAVLDEKGYRRIDGDELSEADLGIYLALGIGPPEKRTHKVSRGMYESPLGQGPLEDVKNSGSGGAGGGSPPPPPPPAPDPLLVGYEELGFKTTVYTKFTSIVAVDLQQYLRDIESLGREDAVPKEVWRVEIETTGTPSDLSEAAAVMLVGVKPYIEKSTPDVVSIKVDSSDSRVRTIANY